MTENRSVETVQTNSCSGHEDSPRAVANLYMIAVILIVILCTANITILLCDIAERGWSDGWEQWQQQQHQWLGPAPVFPQPDVEESAWVLSASASNR